MDSFLYCGRMVPKDGFRAYIYSNDDEKKLVNSYKEFQQCIGSGVWFVKKPENVQVVTAEKPKKKRR